MTMYELIDAWQLRKRLFSAVVHENEIRLLYCNALESIDGEIGGSPFCCTWYCE